MRTRGSWARWALLANGVAVALLGAAYLFVELLLPRIVVGAALVPLTAMGMMSFVPTSIVLGLLTLAALLREGEART